MEITIGPQSVFSDDPTDITNRLPAKIKGIKWT